MDIKTYVILDENNNVIAIADGFKIEMEGCVTKELNEVLDHDKIDGLVWSEDEGKIVFSNTRFEARKLQIKKEDLRNAREEVCFSVVNRGDIWYDKYVNTEERAREFEEWYQAWLDVTDTLVEPETPNWIV